MDIQYVFFIRKLQFVKARTSHKRLVKITDLPDHWEGEAFTPLKLDQRKLSIYFSRNSLTN